MKNKKELSSDVVAGVESALTDLIPVETNRKKVEGDVEKAHAKKLKEVRPVLKPLDKQERDLTEKAFKVLESNLDKKGYLPNGKRSIATRSGTIGHRVSTRVYVKKGTDETAQVGWLEAHGLADCVQIIKRVHLTKLRHAAAAERISRADLKMLGFTIRKKLNRYKRTRTQKNDRVKAARRSVKLKEKE